MPVGPEFQDPPSEVNQLPYFVPPQTTFPFYEQTVTLSGSTMFQAVVNDPNKDDALTVRWIANYPPANSGTIPILNNQPVSRDPARDDSGNSTVSITCEMITTSQGMDHNLVVIVTDKKFLEASMDPAARSTLPYNYEIEPDNTVRLIANMVGWKITGCP